MDWRQGTRKRFLSPECPAAMCVVRLFATHRLADDVGGGNHHLARGFHPVHGVVLLWLRVLVDAKTAREADFRGKTADY